MNQGAVFLLELVWPGLAAAAAAAAILPWLRREYEPARALLMVPAVLLILRYVFWRALETLPAPGLTLDFVAGVTFFVVEAATLAGTCISFVFLCRTRDRSQDVNRHKTLPSSKGAIPMVDVLICTYNEDKNILERTIIGALAIDYPRFRVWVCDDGRRAWLQSLCAQHGCEYVTRPDNRHAKAGNINNALGVLWALPDRPDFISILDADFVPRARFLKRALMLFHDPAIGIVQTPQHFINPDPIQSNLSAASAWPDEQRFFFDVVMTSKDAWGTAFCCGTSSVIKAEPLVAMGGFPTDSVTEDYLVTLRMKEKGLQTAYLNEPLTLGLAPEGLKEYITQRGRWCLGFIQICRGRSGPFSRQSPLSVLDRVCLVEGFISWVFAYSYRLLGLIVPIIYLLFGVKAVEADLKDLLHHFLPFFVWNTMVIGWIAEGRILPIMSDVSQLIAAPTVLKSVAVGLFRPHNQRFKVTAKGGDRSSRFVEWPLMRFFLFLLLLTISGVSAAWLTDGRLEDGGTGLMAMVWSWYNIIVLTIACFVCLELPRLRQVERFDASERVVINHGGGLSRIASLADISILGARLLGPSPAAIGSVVKLRLAGLTVPAEIVRAGSKDFAIRINDDPETRAAMIRHIYAGQYGRKFKAVSPGQLSAAIAKRLWR